MSLLTRIEELQKSPPERKRAALITSVAISMIVIVGIWVLQLRYELNRSNPTNSNTSSPLGLIFNAVRDRIKNIPRP